MTSVDLFSTAAIIMAAILGAVGAAFLYKQNSILKRIFDVVLYSLMINLAVLIACVRWS